MRFAMIGTMMLAMCAPAAACNEQLFTVLDWRADSISDARPRTVVEVDLRYDGERPYRMILAAAMFSDVIGNALVSPGLDRDVKVNPGDEFTVSATFRDAGRNTTINRGDVRSRVCVWSIAYDDGAVEEFE